MHRRLLDRAAALLAPPVCLACSRATDPELRICLRCRRELSALPAGRSSPAAFAAFPYEGAARPIIGALKFRNAPAVAREMAELMRPRLPQWAVASTWIIPVPAHPSRRRARGYNQSLVLARALAEGSSLRVLDCLRRAAVAPPQSELSRAARLRLPVSAISVDLRALERSGLAAELSTPGAVLLCDDVMTTGVTLERCAQALALRQPGAKSLAELPTNVAGWGRAGATTSRLDSCTHANRERELETGSNLIRAVTFASAT